jgi:hypothetical protein
MTLGIIILTTLLLVLPHGGILHAEDLTADDMLQATNAAESAGKAFACQTFAQKMGANEQRQEALFRAGYDAMQLFITTVEKGAANRNAMTDTMAGRIASRIVGSRVDFVIGMLFKGARDHAGEMVWQHAKEEYAGTSDPTSQTRIRRAALVLFHEHGCDAYEQSLPRRKKP